MFTNAPTFMEDVAMPKLNEGAKAWELKVAGRVGQAVKAGAMHLV